MNRVFIGMDVHKEKIVVVGLPEEGSHPVVREEFGGGGSPAADEADPDPFPELGGGVLL